MMSDSSREKPMAGVRAEPESDEGFPVNLFEQFPEEKCISLKGFALACIARLIFQNKEATPKTFEQNFLFDYHLAFQKIPEWEKSLSHYLKNPSQDDVKLVELANKLNLSSIDLLTAALMLAVEEDPMVGRVVAHVQAPLGGSRPTLGLIEAAFSNIFSSQNVKWIAGSLASGKAVRSGVLILFDDNAPLPEQTLRITAALALGLRDKDFVWPGTRFFNSSMSVYLTDSLEEAARTHAASLAGARDNVLVVRSTSKIESFSVANQIAKLLGLEAIFVQPEGNPLIGLGPLCHLNDLIPVYEYEMGPSDCKTLPDIPGYGGPRIVLLGLEGNIRIPSGRGVSWTLPHPNLDERKVIWEHYLGDNVASKRLAKSHMHSPGRIKELSERALRQAELDKRTVANEEDILQAVLSSDDGVLKTLAQPILSTIPDEALVLPRSIRNELDHLVQRCRHRESLGQGLGVTIKARYQVGVRALLVGPSGTGKTLVASWLATKLALPLFRVDIASVVSKYIGETEKNLASLLSRAEQSEVVLLFDEADSLFGKRTDIKDSNDRFANSQTNYLLQRIEFYKGIVLLTSNSRGRFDSAFNRRLDQIIEFPLPASEERRSLWQSHLGKHHRISTRQFNQLAVTSDLAGGHIRNAILTGAVKAKSEERLIQFDDLIAGLAGEYRKLGRQMPAELKRFYNAS